MRKILKWIAALVSVVTLIGGVALVVLAVRGYQEFQDAADAKPLAQAVEEIQKRPDYVPLEEISEDFCNAIVAVEDHRFREHHGVDYFSLARALFTNIKEGRIVEGGSTITQQLAKNLYFDSEQTLTRKFAEIFAAYTIEKEYSKDLILELYCNLIYFGDGYYGIGEASCGYFGVQPGELTLSQATMLAGLPQAPTVYALREDAAAAAKRQQIVLKAMVGNGVLTEEEAAAVVAPVDDLKKAA